MTGYWLTRLVFQRSLGLVYLVAFVCALNQFRPLLGESGLLPASAFMRQVPFRESPSLFNLFPKDAAYTVAAWTGIVLSCLAIAGFSERYATWLSMLLWASLWALYMSFVNVGQVFYGFGWESLRSSVDSSRPFWAAGTSRLKPYPSGYCAGLPSGSCSAPD